MKRFRFTFFWIVLILLLLVLLLVSLWWWWWGRTKDGFSTLDGGSQEGIPRIVWAYWDGDVPPLVAKCIESWKKHNPTYKIIVLNKGNLSTYLPQVDFASMKHVNDSVQRFSDFVRVHVLAEHGGIWIDASTICQAPLDWIQQIQHEKDVEFVGYFTDNMTLPKWRETSPLLKIGPWLVFPNHHSCKTGGMK